MCARIAFILASIFCVTALAGPADISRILKSITFEERRLGNREDLPMHWNKLEGPGLPHYVNGILADDRAHTGNYSFRFDLNGGSLIYQYDPSEIPVQAGAHYRVECYVQTTVLPHAQARMTAFFTDMDGNPIPDTTVRSDLYAATRDDDDWHKLTIELTAGSRSAPSWRSGSNCSSRVSTPPIPWATACSSRRTFAARPGLTTSRSPRFRSSRSLPDMPEIFSN